MGEKEQGTETPAQMEQRVSRCAPSSVARRTSVAYSGSMGNECKKHFLLFSACNRTKPSLLKFHMSFPARKCLSFHNWNRNLRELESVLDRNAFPRPGTAYIVVYTPRLQGHFEGVRPDSLVVCNAWSAHVSEDGAVFNFFFVAVDILEKQLEISCRTVSPSSESDSQSHAEMAPFSLPIYLWDKVSYSHSLACIHCVVKDNLGLLDVQLPSFECCWANRLVASQTFLCLIPRAFCMLGKHE